MNHVRWRIFTQVDGSFSHTWFHVCACAVHFGARYKREQKSECRTNCGALYGRQLRSSRRTQLSLRPVAHRAKVSRPQVRVLITPTWLTSRPSEKARTTQLIFRLINSIGLMFISLAWDSSHLDIDIVVLITYYPIRVIKTLFVTPQIRILNLLNSKWTGQMDQHGYFQGLNV